MFHLEPFHKGVSKARVEIDLQRDRHRNEQNIEESSGDVIGLKEKTQGLTGITSMVKGKNPKFSWIDWNESEMAGTFIAYPERESVPENIKEQLIVELYSK